MSCEGNDTVPGPVQHEFSYENSKIAFNQELFFVLYTKGIVNKVVHKTTDVDKIINDIRQNKSNLSYFYSKCQIKNVNGEDILAEVKVIEDNNKTLKVEIVKQIISLDELFDVMSELHMQKPYLNEDEIINHLSNCVLPVPLVTLFRKSCKTCNSTIRNPYWYYRVVGEITKFELDLPDGRFANVLLYVERNTNFVLLRPLQSLSDNEIAYELVTIFADFGIPANMDSHNFSLEQCHSILNILRSIEPPFKVPKMVATNRKHKVILTTTRARQMLIDWMKETGSTNWAIGAHVVQWQMNTSKVFDSYIRSRVVFGLISSPYHAMFGLLPRTDLVQIKKKPQLGSTFKSDKVLVDCSQCQQSIFKIFTCYFCKRPCHFSCCVRFVDHAMEAPILINKCLSCVNSDLSGDEMILGT